MNMESNAMKENFETQGASIFDRLESEVQSYARSFPEVFDRALNAHIYDRSGNSYLDFLSGAGSLNYGHNNPVLKKALIDYIERDGITHSLDLHTEAKGAFLKTFDRFILRPRKMEYVVQFTGPTGTNAVEAALKIARNITGRTNVISFTNGFHGVSLGAVSMTGNTHHRNAAGLPLGAGTAMPYDGYIGDGIDTIDLIEKMLCDKSSGLDHPAAMILETVQGEGGINVASVEWLRRAEELCRKHGILLIVDDIQAGCGRTGHFFSFEEARISPDIVTLSKSLSGYGLPFAIVLIKPEYDCWKPGEHNGTFRGNNHAFITAAKALAHYWADDTFGKFIQSLGAATGEKLSSLVRDMPDIFIAARGRGLMRGIECRSGELAAEISQEAFRRGLIIETSGADSQVLKLLPPLTISEEDLKKGLEIIEKSSIAVLTKLRRNPQLSAA
jgi:diaminobutyrate-2-oxoglutarate transaminase